MLYQIPYFYVSTPGMEPKARPAYLIKTGFSLSSGHLTLLHDHQDEDDDDDDDDAVSSDKNECGGVVAVDGHDRDAQWFQP